LLKIASPEAAVMECLKKRGGGLEGCSPVRIADEVGMLLVVVIGVIGGLLGSE